MTPYDVPTRSEVRRIVELAGLAPSVHNTQPWLFAAEGDAISLYADLSRQLRVEDPLGRNLVISCGSALHHLQVAAGALGWAADVERTAGTAHPTLLARVRLMPSHATADPDALVALRRRRTDRRRFTSWPIPDQRLLHLAEVADRWGAHAVALLDDAARVRLDLILRTARAERSGSTAAVEQERWTDRGDHDGIPSGLVPVDAEQSRFGAGRMANAQEELESSDAMVVLGGVADDAQAWLRTGEALSALWLRATEDNLSVVPLSEVVEVERTRGALRREVLGGLVVPHLVARVGWQAIGRSDLPASPRRPVDDILRA